MGLHQIGKAADYVRYLRENASEVDLLFKKLLIEVTAFFCDPDAWEPLRAAVLAELLPADEKGGVVRVWVPACSTGEEAYSLAWFSDSRSSSLSRPGRSLFRSTRQISTRRPCITLAWVSADVPADYGVANLQEDAP